MIIQHKKISEDVSGILDELQVAEATKDVVKANISFREDKVHDKLKSILTVIRQMTQSESCDGIIEGYSLVLYDMVFQTLNALGMANMKPPLPPQEIDSDAKTNEDHADIGAGH